MLAGLINSYPYTNPTIIKVVNVFTYILEYGVEVLPCAAFLNGLSDITTVKYDTLKDAFATKGILFISTMFLIADFFIYFIIAIAIELYTNRAPRVPEKSPAQIGTTQNETADVSAARNHAESEVDNNDLVVVKNLRKEFGSNFTAVKNLSMPIRVNECFGLLG